jgi:hypothetical protein
MIQFSITTPFSLEARQASTKPSSIIQIESISKTQRDLQDRRESEHPNRCIASKTQLVCVLLYTVLYLHIHAISRPITILAIPRKPLSAFPLANRVQQTNLFRNLQIQRFPLSASQKRPFRRTHAHLPGAGLKAAHGHDSRTKKPRIEHSRYCSMSL